MEFEQYLKELEKIVQQLDDGNTTLDQSVSLFEKGIDIGKKCLDALSETKGKVLLLQKKLEEITATEIKIEEEEYAGRIAFTARRKR